MLVTGKEYVRPISWNWWLRKRSYFLFMLRELTALFVAGYAIFLMVLIYRAGQGSDALTGFVESLKSPASGALHALVLAMAIYHTVTWFNAAPKALVIWRGDARVGPAFIAAVHYVAWIVASILVAGLAIAAGRG